MAWVFPEGRCCPSCGYLDRILLTQCKDDMFRLSCGWCANLSEPMPAMAAVFEAWGGDLHGYDRGAVLDFEGVPHWFKGAYIESVPIRAILGRETVLVTERKNAA